MTVTRRRAITASLVVVLWYPATASGQTLVLNDLQLLLAQDAVLGDFVGSAVAISGNGNTIAVGAPRSLSSVYFTPAEGAVYVFERDQASGVWSQQARLTASAGGESPVPQDHFGAALAISDDGNTLIIGAPLPGGGTNVHGRVYVFHREGTSWTMSQQLAEGVRTFGGAVALRGSTLVIGAPLGGFPVAAGMAFVYRREPDGWTPAAQLVASDRRWEDDFGASVAVDEDENTIIIGAPGEGNPDDRCPGGGGFPDCRRGAAYVFELDPLNGRWAERAKLLAPPESARAHHEFGSSVSISAAIAVVGAPGDIGADSAGSSAAYVFYGPDWHLNATLIPSNRRLGHRVGRSVAIWGRNILVGAPRSDETCPPSQFGGCDSGSAFLFQWSAGSWLETAQLAARDAALGRQFGSSVAMVGTHLAVGAWSGGSSLAYSWGVGRAYAFWLGPDAPDLVSTAVSDPPSIANVGDTFSATDTVLNVGSATSRSATTRYYFSPDGRKHGLDGYAGAARTIGVLGVLRSSTGTRTLTVPSVKAGAYFLIACTDEMQTNVESNESNNCVASAGTTQVSGADLVEIAISNPPANVTLGGSFAVSDAVANEGNLPAPASITRYYFSLDRVRDSSDELFVQSRIIAPLNPGTSSPGTVTVGIPRMPGGAYFLLACADSSNAVVESDEINNCRASSGYSVVLAPDLQVTAVSAPPAGANLGSTFPVSHTLRNTGNKTAGSSTTRFYLSLDTGIDSTDTLLIGSRQVEGPGAGGTYASTTSVQIPSTPIGRYHLLACADDLRTVSEGDESNNCLASATTVSIAGADLVERAVSNPPPAAVLGSTFTVTDIMRNDGNIAAGASTVRYYLSFDARADASDARFAQTRTVGSLAPGASSIGSVPVVVPPMPSGSYLLLACADDPDTIVESAEENNCQASTTTVIVTGPDLVITALNAVLPVVVPFAGLVFVETAANLGDGPAAASSTRYYFSANQTRGSADLPLIGSRAVGPLGAGASATAPVSVTVPLIPPGTSSDRMRRRHEGGRRAGREQQLSGVGNQSGRALAVKRATCVASELQ